MRSFKDNRIDVTVADRVFFLIEMALPARARFHAEGDPESLVLITSNPVIVLHRLNRKMSKNDKNKFDL